MPLLLIFQGQTKVYAKFGKNVYLPQDAEFYFIYNGSHQRHIVFAERTEDNVLQSSIPGEEPSLPCSWEICSKHLHSRSIGWERPGGEKGNCSGWDGCECVCVWSTHTRYSHFWGPSSQISLGLC